MLYAANFSAGTIEAYDPSFGAPATVTGNFTNPSLPAGYAPFNDKVINGELYVTYAVQDADKHDDVAGPGLGIVDVFNLDGVFNRRLISNGGALESPWGLQIAPASFGSFAGDLLVGNFGNGMINAFDATTGAFVGALTGRTAARSSSTVSGASPSAMARRMAEASTPSSLLRGLTAKVTACSGVWRFPSPRHGR